MCYYANPQRDFRWGSLQFVWLYHVVARQKLRKTCWLSFKSPKIIRELKWNNLNESCSTKVQCVSWEATKIRYDLYQNIVQPYKLKCDPNKHKVMVWRLTNFTNKNKEHKYKITTKLMVRRLNKAVLTKSSCWNKGYP